MLTVALKSNIVIGAIQVLNKELSAGTDGEFTERDLALLQEVAEYSSTLIHRMVDPKFVLERRRHRAFRRQTHRPAPSSRSSKKSRSTTNSSKSPATPSSAAKASSPTNARAPTRSPC
jgi:hypothetical protein